MKKRFCELAVGARFEYRGKRYEKMNGDVGRDEERGGNVFAAETEVLAEAGLARGHHAGCRVQSEPPTLCPAPAGRRVAVRPVWRPRPRYVRNRLGRSPDRDLRPYGTV